MTQNLDNIRKEIDSFITDVLSVPYVGNSQKNRTRERLNTLLEAHAQERISEERDSIRLRRERELYLVAESARAEGWDFDRYLNAWAALMQQSTPPVENHREE